MRAKEIISEIYWSSKEQKWLEPKRPEPPATYKNYVLKKLFPDRKVSHFWTDKAGKAGSGTYRVKLWRIKKRFDKAKDRYVWPSQNIINKELAIAQKMVDKAGFKDVKVVLRGNFDPWVSLLIPPKRLNKQGKWV